MADGFMMLANGDLPNGSVMRVTARSRGSKVVHDLVVYGKELGGSAVRTNPATDPAFYHGIHLARPPPGGHAGGDSVAVTPPGL